MIKNKEVSAVTRERLRRYRYIKQEQHDMERQLEEIEASLYGATAKPITGMPSGHGGGNPAEELAIKHLELLELYTRKKLQLATERQAIETAIEALEPPARMLLRYIYIDGLRWREACDLIHYSRSQANRIHDKAMQQLQDMDAQG